MFQNYGEVLIHAHAPKPPPDAPLAVWANRDEFA
jgi:hypothetical protein